MAKACLNSGPRTAFGGILTQQVRWGLSRRGKVLAAALLVVLAYALLRGLYPFLAISQPVAGSILVVEGWIPAYALNDVASQLHSNQYNKVIVLRGLYRGGGRYESAQFTGRYMVDTLVELGVPNERVELILFDAVNRDRTYQSALALRGWCSTNALPLTEVNVVTMGPHARRSRTLFERALGAKTTVGIIALRDQTYDADHWWRSSAGLREVPFELLAYLYAKFLFRA